MSTKRAHKEEITEEEYLKRLYTHVSTKAEEFGSFLKLPQNVITKILMKCNVSDLVKLALVSKRCRDIIWFSIGLKKIQDCLFFPVLFLII